MRAQPLPVKIFATAVAALLMPWAGTALAAQVAGRILGPAGVTPITGATITFHHLGSGSTITSEPSTADGSYGIPSLPAGRYDIAVRTGRGLWLVDQPVVFTADEAKTLSFALRERAYWEGADKVPQRTTPPDPEVVGVAVLLESEREATTRHPRRRRNILMGTGIGLGVLALAHLASGNNQGSGPEASPFTPAP